MKTPAQHLLNTLLVLPIVHPNRARESCSCTHVVMASLGAIYCYWHIEPAALLE
jgi:hypothetical protein